MILTGKCKENFEKWLSNQYINSYKIEEWFYGQKENMQYGVYVDFAEKYAKDNNQSNHILKIFRLYYVEMGYSLDDARIESVKKFNLIYNTL